MPVTDTAQASEGKKRNEDAFQATDVPPNSPVFTIRRVQHFPGFIFVSRKLLYFEAQESVVLRFQPVCIAVRSIPHKLL